MKQQRKQVSDETRAMLDAMTEDAARPAAADKVDIARKKTIELRDLEQQRADYEEKLKETNKAIEKIKWQELPDLLSEAKLDSMTVAAEGNMPSFTVQLEDQFHANIPKENEQPAYKWLHKQGMGDMVKTTFTVAFGLGEAKECAAFRKKLDKLGEPYDLKQQVPWNTLTSWIKGEFKDGRPLSERTMGLLGATHRRVATVKKPKKEK